MRSPASGGIGESMPKSGVRTSSRGGPLRYGAKYLSKGGDVKGI